MFLKLVTIATYLTPEEAELAKSVLERESIKSFLEGDGLVGMVWYLSNAVGGVKLQVEEADVERAKEILKEEYVPPKKDVSQNAAIYCPNCNSEIDPGFDVCWSCGAEIDRETILNSNKAIQAEHTDQNDVQEVDLTTEPGDNLAQRAWNAAIIGIFVLPPLLNIYSIWVMIKINSKELSLSKSSNRKYNWALAVDSIIIFIALLVGALIFR